MTDAISGLALSMVSNPGAYVLIVGSGVSRSAGIPTGWEVVETLIGRVAVAAGEPLPADPPAWYEARRGSPPSYTTLIQSLAPRPAERIGLLTGFFEATPTERDQGLKVPTTAHRAIAELVQLGVVRVIVTTNFDRLLEAALVDVGIAPTVVSSDDDLSGIPPLTQIGCLIVKAHGDYRDLRIRNTPDEVATLDPGIASHLEGLFRAYGLLVVGWSAQYDVGLRGVLLAAGRGGYSAHWASRSAPGPEAAALIEALDASLIRIRDADSFFHSLVESVRSVRELMRNGPVDDEVMVATAKRLLQAPGSQIALSDLVGAEVEQVRGLLEGPRPTSMTTSEEYRDWLQHLNEAARRLVRLYATIGYWGLPEHGSILVRGLERLTRWGVEGGIGVVIQSRLYPALLALYAAGVCATAAPNFPMLALLLRARLPTSDPRVPGDEDSAPTPLVLTGSKVLDHSGTNGILNIGQEKRLNYHTPQSVYLERTLRPLTKDAVPGDEDFERALDTFEALLAMRYVVDGGTGVPTGQYAYRNKRSFVGRGVPERFQAELGREGSAWPAVLSGLFDDQGDAETALARMVERLPDFSW